MLVLWFLILGFSLSCLYADNNDMQCRIVEGSTGCKCVFPTGLGIDLWPLHKDSVWYVTLLQI